jgi:hypothetical protein
LSLYLVFAILGQDLNYVNSHRLQFGKLGEMIAARSRLKEHSRFLFIPGPDDAGTAKLNDAHLADKLLVLYDPLLYTIL